MIARIEDIFSIDGKPTERIETKVVFLTLEGARARPPAPVLCQNSALLK